MTRLDCSAQKFLPELVPVTIGPGRDGARGRWGRKRAETVGHFEFVTLVLSGQGPKTQNLFSQPMVV